MADFFDGASTSYIGINLLTLSLDALRPALNLLAAPTVVEDDYIALRNWTAHWDDLNYFPTIIEPSFADTILSLERAMPPGRGAVFLDWAVRSTPLCDPSLERPETPWHAAQQWHDSLTAARAMKLLSGLGLSDAGQTVVIAELQSGADRMQPVIAFAKTLEREWEAYPEDPKQLDYNLRCKTPWDRHVYEKFSRVSVFDPCFEVVSIAQVQEIHRFVRAYASQLSPADHAAIRENLANVLAFRDTHPTHAHAVARLRSYAASPLESLVRFTRMPV